MDKVSVIPTDVLSCLLDRDHESALPVHYCWARLYFYLMSAALWSKCLVLLRDLCGGFDMQSCSLLTDGQSDMEP